MRSVTLPEAAGQASDPDTDWRACRVLVVDDSSVSRQLVGGFLTAAGVASVELASDGEEALARVESFAPDLVILDIVMPNLDGFEVCRRLRADPRHRRLPILVQTGLDSLDRRMEVFQAGATDLVVKPVNGPELIARTRVHLENRLLVSSLEAYRAHVQEELALAREMQLRLLPDPAAVQAAGRRCGLDIRCHFEPSAELGGDCWGASELGDGRLGLFVADFSGHGVAAALNTFRLHALIRQAAPETTSPAAFLGRLNRHLVELLPPNQFATLLYAVLDGPGQTLTFAGAGSPRPVLGRGQRLEMLDSSGLPLGVDAAAAYRDQTLPFAPGSFLFLYSDALTDTPDAGGRRLDDEDVLSLARTAARHPDPLPLVLAVFSSGHAAPTDDLTALWVARS